MKVLVADDDLSTRILMERLITGWGYDVVCVCDGNEAWDVLTNDDPPQIAVLDWSMPGKTGVEICAMCARDGLPVYRILVTAKDEEQDFIYAIDNGAHDFQSKPIVPGILKSRLSVGKRFIDWFQETVSSERLAAVGRLVAGIAHHFNNLNTPILMYASSILSKENLDDGIRKKMEKIEKAAEQAKDLTERLMAFASNKTMSKTPVNLNNIVMDMIELESIETDRNNITVVTELSPLPEIMVHEADIRHVVMNLFKNACHALMGRPEKKIRIETHCDDGTTIHMAISDTGCGISSGRLQNIFSIFYTEKGEFAKPGSPMNDVKGTGLGLYASKSIIMKHGGNITVDSKVDKGTTFRIRLPISHDDTSDLNE